MDQQQPWYNNKELFEMLNDFKEEIGDLRLEMKETKTLIRDYNGLRASVNDVSERIGKCEKTIDENKNSRKEYIGYILAAISTLFLLLNYFK